MTRLLITILFVARYLWIQEVFADTTECTQQQAMEAESVAGTAKSWTQLHNYFAKYAHCDDGAVGEGFSESVSLLLSNQWGNFTRLSGLLKSDPEFRDFILRHVDETVPVERLRNIAKNAVTRCPRSIKSICLEIESKASHLD